MVDQMRADAICALGNDEIITPNLDRLVNRGTAFSNAFSPSPVCVPARCSYHYGMYPSASGCFENNFSMPDSSPSFMDVLSDGGYRTHAVGKCHFTPDLLALRGFQSRQVQEELLDDWRKDDYLKWLFSNPANRHILDPHGVRGDRQLGNLNAKIGGQHVRTPPYGEMVLRKFEVDGELLKTGKNKIELTYDMKKKSGGKYSGQMKSWGNFIAYDFIRFEEIK